MNKYKQLETAQDGKLSSWSKINWHHSTLSLEELRCKKKQTKPTSDQEFSDPRRAAVELIIRGK